MISAIDSPSKESENKMKHLSIHPNHIIQELAAVALHAHKDNSPGKIHINAVALEHDGELTRFVATNGHTLAVATIENFDSDLNTAPFTLILPLDVVQEMVKSAKANGLMHVHVIPDERLIRHCNKAWSIPADENTFPPYVKIFPKFDGAENKLSEAKKNSNTDNLGEWSATISLAAEYSALVGKTFELADPRPTKEKKLRNQGLTPIVMRIGGEFEPIVFASEVVPTVKIVVMPSRLPDTRWISSMFNLPKMGATSKVEAT